MYNNMYGMYGGYPVFGQNMMYQALKRPGLFRRLFGGLGAIDFGNILNQTSKTLNVVNQAIPIIYQVKPLVNNARTMLRIANIIKTDSPVENVSSKESNNQVAVSEIKNEELNNSSNGPTFYL